MKYWLARLISILGHPASVIMVYSFRKTKQANGLT